MEIFLTYHLKPGAGPGITGAVRSAFVLAKRGLERIFKKNLIASKLNEAAYGSGLQVKSS